MTRRAIGGLVIAIGLLCAVAAIPLWIKASSDAEDAQLAGEYRAAIIGGGESDTDANRVPSLVAVGGGVVAVLVGTIVVVTARPGPAPGT